jgi:hypothetical protein
MPTPAMGIHQPVCLLEDGFGMLDERLVMLHKRIQQPLMAINIQISRDEQASCVHARAEPAPFGSAPADRETHSCVVASSLLLLSPQVTDCSWKARPNEEGCLA